MHPHLPEFIQYAKKLGFFTYLTTNGSVGSVKRLKSIFYAGLDSIKFSYNYIDGEQNFGETAGAPTKQHMRIKENIHHTLSFKKNGLYNIKLYISCVSVKPKSAVLEALGTMFEGVDEILHYPLVSQAGQTSQDILQNGVYAPLKKPLFCEWPFTKLRITSEGYVNACCVDFQNFLAMGDTAKAGLQDIWENDSYQRLRDKLIQQDLSELLCDGCLHNAHRAALPICPELASYPQI